MILILSTPNDDDTNLVMEHLSILHEKCIRINDLDLFTGKTKMHLELRPQPKWFVENIFLEKVDLSEVKCVWYRKFGFFEKYKEKLENEKNIRMLDYLKSEHTATLDVIFDFFKNKKWLNHYSNVKKISKIGNLIEAQNTGLKIPKTYITNSFDDLNQEQSYITKSIKDGAVVNIDEKIFPFYTSEVNTKAFTHYENFFPSLFQEKINKEYELRIFHLNGKNYSMAIFSQNDKQTQLDFRQYNYKNPNRFIPYTLPKDIDRKISVLMKNLGLNTGSLDMIKATDGEYYFLEINPSGQFRMTSLPCNYNLHYEVAQYLKSINQ
ncbi:MAG: grasp-with-spasm system ATP-grasp peptide maturase [Flavobacteriaceae bacterium]|jgi:ATP-GRASP peptide maturase of grasp-with-spasm system|nr:grasp-with-spasm system ATP-grasp peptide maturase [Flavobacteriaceae bacterium]